MSTAANDNDQNQEKPYIRDSSAKETRETYRKMMEEALNKQKEQEQQKT